jgi:hypothetical protein
MVGNVLLKIRHLMYLKKILFDFGYLRGREFRKEKGRH